MTPNRTWSSNYQDYSRLLFVPKEIDYISTIRSNFKFRIPSAQTSTSTSRNYPPIRWGDWLAYGDTLERHWNRPLSTWHLAARTLTSTKSHTQWTVIAVVNAAKSTRLTLPSPEDRLAPELICRNFTHFYRSPELSEHRTEISLSLSLSLSLRIWRRKSIYYWSWLCKELICIWISHLQFIWFLTSSVRLLPRSTRSVRGV